MSQRDYDREPIILGIHLRIFAYGEADVEALRRNLQTEDKQEFLFLEATDSISGDVGLGLDEITVTSDMDEEPADVDADVELLKRLKMLQMQEAEDACYFDVCNDLQQQLEERLGPDMTQLAELQAEQAINEDCEE